jgi:hypothetical protein
MKALAMKFPWFGITLVAIGAALLVLNLRVVHVGWPTVIWAVIGAVGAVKLIRGITARCRREAFWGVVLLAAGLLAAMVREDVYDIGPGVAFAGLMMAVGAGFIVMFLLAPGGWRVLIPALIFLVFGASIMAVELDFVDRWQVGRMLATFWPVAFIAWGAALLVPGKMHRAE